MFSWWTTHPVTLKSITKVPNQRVARRRKCFLFFLQTCQFKFAWISLWFFQHFPLSSAPAHRFLQVWSPTRQLDPLTGELWLPLWRLVSLQSLKCVIIPLQDHFLFTYNSQTSIQGLVGSSHSSLQQGVSLQYTRTRIRPHIHKYKG